MKIRTTVIHTPIGPLALLALDGGGLPGRTDRPQPGPPDGPGAPAGDTPAEDTLVASGFTDDPRELHARLHPSLRSYGLEPAAGPGAIGAAHEAYFDGDLTALDDLAVYQPGSWRREALWTALRRVPAGRTVTYGELAAQAGLERAARAAGQACAQNLVAPVIPCHRVLPANGPKRAGGYYYGSDRKEWLLRHESARG